MATASLSLWIASHAATTSEGIYQAYIHAYSIIDFILCLVHVGIVFLVTEADPLFWRGPRDPKRIRWWCALFRLWSYAAGWHMAFCLSTIRLSVALTTQLDALGYVAVNTGLTPEQDIVIEDMLKIMFFFSGFLLLIPFWFVVSWQLHLPTRDSSDVDAGQSLDLGKHGPSRKRSCLPLCHSGWKWSSRRDDTTLGLPAY